MVRNVYDFDKTVYAGDSSVHFYCWCALRRPWIVLDLLCAGAWGLLYLTGRIDKTRFKQRIYRFLTFLPDVDAAVESFWRTHKKNIKPWYDEKRAASDLIISASPEFLLSPICRELGVSLLASRVDRRTGIYDGLNCHGAEKVRRMREAYPDTVIDAFYSDSLSDTPLAELAERAYRVRGNEIAPFFPAETPDAQKGG